MTGRWEQYVEQAAETMWESFRPGVWPRGDGVLEPIPTWAECAEAERESCRDEVRAALVVVGPLIAEDTRVRMVEAAAEIVKREGLASLYYCPAGDEIEQHPGGGFDICCDALDRHEPISPQALAAARREVAEEIAVAIEGQLVGLLDGFQARSAAAAAAREVAARRPS